MWRLAFFGILLILFGGASIYFALKNKKTDSNLTGIHSRLEKGGFAIKNLLLPGILVLLGALMLYGAIFEPVE